MEKEIETIEGFDIPLRVLTEEEASREINLGRFQDFHHAVGEDFIDQVGSVNTEKIAYQFMGFALAKLPEWNEELLSSCNRNNPYTQLVQEVYSDYDENMDCDLFYSDFAEFVNLTVHTKMKVNQVLIQIEEHYA